MKLAKLIQSRPEDRVIYAARVAFGILLFALIGYSFPFVYIALLEEYVIAEITVRTLLFIFPLIFIAAGIGQFCIGKRKTSKTIQMVVGILMIMSSFFIALQEIPVEPTTQTSIDFTHLEQEKEANGPWIPNLSAWLFWLGFIPLIAGISGKCITKGCLKHKEQITKIRV